MTKTLKTDGWNEQIIKNPDGGNVFQSTEFANQKELTGWSWQTLNIKNTAITIHVKNLPGLGKLWYVPKGPGVGSVGELAGIINYLKTEARKNGVFAVKIEPEIIKNKSNQERLKKLGLLPVQPIQPNFSTITIDLSPKLDSIMSNLNQKGRHAIRRAERDGVEIKAVESSSKNSKIMYRLLQDTASGQFSIRKFSYYENFWQSFESAGLGQMFFAYYKGRVVAAAYALIFGQKSTYKDGASLREKSVYGASHLLQWEVIKWAKSKGSKLHDLCGAPPSDQINNPNHRHYGIGRFKSSFNKTVTDFVGAYDLPIRPLRYKIWIKLCEKIAVKIHWKLKHESWY